VNTLVDRVVIFRSIYTLPLLPWAWIHFKVDLTPWRPQPEYRPIIALVFRGQVAGKCGCCLSRAMWLGYRGLQTFQTRYSDHEASVGCIVYFPTAMTRWLTGILANHESAIPQSPPRCGDVASRSPSHPPRTHQKTPANRQCRVRKPGTSRTPTTLSHKMWTSIAGTLHRGIGKGRECSYNYHFAVPDS
jgi:hypothetical protein